MVNDQQLSKLTAELNRLYCETLRLADQSEKDDITIGRLESIIEEQEGWLRELLTSNPTEERKKFILDAITPYAKDEHLKEE